MTLTLTRPKYVHRRNKELARLLLGARLRECDECGCNLTDEDHPVFCEDCASHDYCLPDDGDYVEVHQLIEHARALKFAMLECRTAKLYRAQEDIEGALRVIYPEWPGLVAP